MHQLKLVFYFSIPFIFLYYIHSELLTSKICGSMASCRNVQDMYKGERMNTHCINSEYLKYMEYITTTQHVSSQVAENIHMSYSTHVQINPFHIIVSKSNIIWRSDLQLMQYIPHPFARIWQ